MVQVRLSPREGKAEKGQGGVGGPRVITSVPDVSVAF